MKHPNVLAIVLGVFLMTIVDSTMAHLLRTSTKNHSQTLQKSEDPSNFGVNSWEKLQYKTMNEDEENNEVLTHYIGTDSCPPGFARAQDGVCYEILPTPIPL